MKPTKRAVWALLAALLAASVWAQTQIPVAGLRAEMEGRWDEAISIYRSVLVGHPDRQDLWVRVAEIEGSQNRPREAADALRRAAALDPKNDDLWIKLSKACAESGDKGGALEAAKRALELEPSDPEYLRAGAQLASWNEQYAYALELFSRLLQLNPEDDQALLGLARVESYLGESSRAVRDYRAYLERNPQDKAARMEYILTVTWRGAYAKAARLLKEYRQDFGSDDPYERQLALVDALARRSERALAITRPGLLSKPDDFILAYAQTIALANGRQPVQALESLKELEKLRPGDPLGQGARLFVTTPLRSTLSADVGYSKDSDSLSIWTYRLQTRLKINPLTFITAGGRWDDLSAPLGSGLEAINGSENASVRGAWLGISHRFSPRVAADLTVGGADVREGASTGTYTVGIDVQPTDALALRFSRSYGFYTISPRALSLDIRQASNRIDLSSDLGLAWHLDAEGAYDTFSDGNNRWELAVAPRREVLRTGSFNLDVGVRGWWFGFEDNFGHGYYAPTQYQRYALTAFGYWKIDDNDGIGFVLAPGCLKDNTMESFHFGLDASLQGTFGIYRDWMLQVSVSHVDNNRVSSGAYRGTAGRISIVRRF